MKKFISLFLAIVMLAMLVGCNNVPSGGGDNKGDTPKAELSRGTIDGDVYTNEYLGFKFTKPESWVYSTDEEIAAIALTLPEMPGSRKDRYLKQGLQLVVQT